MRFFLGGGDISAFLQQKSRYRERDLRYIGRFLYIAWHLTAWLFFGFPLGKKGGGGVRREERKVKGWIDGGMDIGTLRDDVRRSRVCVVASGMGSFT